MRVIFIIDTLNLNLTCWKATMYSTMDHACLDEIVVAIYFIIHSLLIEPRWSLSGNKTSAGNFTPAAQLRSEHNQSIPQPYCAYEWDVDHLPVAHCRTSFYCINGT